MQFFPKMKVVFYNSAHFMYLWGINSFLPNVLSNPAKYWINTLIWCIVYIQSMTLFLTIFQGSLMAKCHWPKSMTHGHKPDVHNQNVIDQWKFWLRPWWNGNLYKSVVDRSMTVWLWTSGLWPCVIDFGQWHLAISEPWKIVKKSVIDWMYTICG